MKSKTGIIQISRLAAVIFFAVAALILFARSSGAVEKESGIMGNVFQAESGKPVPNAYVYVYTAEKGMRGAQIGAIGIADRVSRGTSGDGSYKVALPPGNYYVVARKRVSGLNFGPLHKGDWYDHSTAREVIVVEDGKYLHCDFKLQQLTEPMFFQGLTAEGKKTRTGIRGKLLNGKGEHIPGTFVMAFANDDMRRVPDFTSTVTDDEGNYTLYLPNGGRYWIAARQGYMGAPHPGEPFARYDGSPDHSIKVEDNHFLDGIDLFLKPYEGDPPKSQRAR
jgi:hypothetical protein